MHQPRPGGAAQAPEALAPLPAWLLPPVWAGNRGWLLREPQAQGAVIFVKALIQPEKKEKRAQPGREEHQARRASKLPQTQAATRAACTTARVPAEQKWGDP